jgi:hypothetical protein
VIWHFLRLTWKTPSSLNSFLFPLLLGCIFHVNFPLIQIQYPPPTIRNISVLRVYLTFHSHI